MVKFRKLLYLAAYYTVFTFLIGLFMFNDNNWNSYKCGMMCLWIFVAMVYVIKEKPNAKV